MPFLFCLMAGQAVLSAQTLSFPDEYDFGTIYERDGKTVRTVTFTNTSPVSVEICSVTSACRCVSGEAVSETVAPGQTGSIRIMFDPAYRSGVFSYGLTVWYADRKAHRTFVIKGEVVPMLHPVEEDHPYSFGEGFYTSHEVLPLGKIRPGETRSMFFRYGNGTSRPMQVCFEVEGCCSAHITFERQLDLGPDERGKLYVNVTMPEGYSGSHINRIWPVVNGVRLEKPILVKFTTNNN